MASNKCQIVLIATVLVIITAVLPVEIATARGAKGWCTIQPSSDDACFGDPQAACEAQHDTFWGGNSKLSAYSGSYAWWAKQCNWNRCYGLSSSDCSHILPGRVYFECNNDGISYLSDDYLVPVPPGRCIPRRELQPERPLTCDVPIAGNPIIIQTGAKIESATDYESADGLFNLTRYYRSFTSSVLESYRQEPLGLVQGWRFGHSMELHLSESPHRATLHLPDGSALNYKRLSDGSMVPKDADEKQVEFSLSFVGEWPEDLDEVRKMPTQWSVRDSENKIYLLETIIPERNEYQQHLIGRVTSITDQNGYQQIFSYGDFGELESITDSYSRQMSFTWEFGEHIDGSDVRTIPIVASEVVFPDESTALYGYESVTPSTQALDVRERLANVTRYDSDGVIIDSTQYHYENETFHYALTGITDHRGIRVSSWGYDDYGRAILSEGANGVDRTTITYDDGDTPRRIVRNALGKETVYRFERYGYSSNPGMRLITVDGKPSTHCVETRRRIAYNADGFYDYTEDEEGNRTRYKYDDNDIGLPNRIYEAAGTDDQRLTKISWNHALRLPTRIADSRLDTRFYYDDQGRLIKVIQTDLTTHTSPYSTRGRKRTWRYGYSDTGQLLYIDQPLPSSVDRIYYSYGQQGYLSRIKDELDHVTKISSVNDRGQPTNIVDANGVRIKYGYDSLGRVTSIKIESDDNPTWRFSYDAVGNLVTIKRPDGSYLRYTYDDANRLRKVHNNAKEAIYYKRDAMGNVTRRYIKDSSNTLVFDQQQTFDELGRLLSIVGADYQSWTYAYNKVGNVASVEDPAAHTVTYGYDGLHRIIETIDQEQASTTLEHTEHDDLAEHRDPRDVTTRFLRNGWGEVIREISPDRGTIDYVRNERGWVTQMTDARGKVTNTQYDGAGRVLSTSYPTDPSFDVTYGYDDTSNGNHGVGRSTSTVDSTGSTHYYYNGQGDITQTTQVIDGQTYVIRYDYTQDRLTSITYPSGAIVHYRYDNIGQVAAIDIERDGQITSLGSVQWMPFGPVNQVMFSNGVTELRHHDQNYRLSEIHLSSRATPVVNLQYRYDDGKYLTAIDDLLNSAYSQSYSYSPTGRLAFASGPWGNITADYDSSGNRLSYSDSETSQICEVEVGSNRLLSTTGSESTVYAYDASGNRTRKSDGEGITDYLYNDAQHLSAVLSNSSTVGSYSYNSISQLTIHETGFGVSHYIYGGEGNRLMEADGSGAVLREYIWLGNRPIAILMPQTGDIYLIHTDHLDRPIMVTDQDAITVWQATWEPWGKHYELFSSGHTNLSMRFPGQWDTAEKSLFYNWHRYYDPETGRYTQSDPIGLEGGDNTYLYSNANPLNYVDRDGLYALLTPRVGPISPSIPKPSVRPIPAPRRIPIPDVSEDEIGSGRFMCKVKCNVVEIKGKGHGKGVDCEDGNCPQTITGIGRGSSPQEAWNNAKKSANQLPRGCQKRHCRGIEGSCKGWK